MKVVLIFCLFLVFSCSHEKTAPIINDDSKKETIDNAQLPIPQPSPLPVPKVEISNYDEKFQDSLKDVWNKYFRENFNESRSMDIYIVTNRNNRQNDFGCTNNHFGINLNENSKSIYGVCRISVPKNHSTGQINATLDNKLNTNSFYKFVQSKKILPEQLFEFIKKTKRTPLVFVHGFNVRYQDAVLRASQLAYDLKYQGPILLYTWPSGAEEGIINENNYSKTYEQNKKNALESIQDFREFISNFYQRDIKINLFVHSMGHQVVIPALNEIGIEFGQKFINELILNAPDYEVNDFQNKIENVSKTVKRITLYCSKKDKAIMASTSFNKNQRLGACINHEGVDSINVESVDDSTFSTGHSYYSSRAVLTDIFQVLIGLDAQMRLFIKKANPNGQEMYFLRD